jgi:hypothetical protein
MNKELYTKIIVTISLIFMSGFVLANPNGAGIVSEIKSSNGPASTVAANHSAIAGNVTELLISGNSITQSWQGYYGNVSGAIRLADTTGNPMYNWSLASPQGEVFASTANSITWSNIECFNWTADGEALEVSFNINNSEDGINETFTDGNSHEAFSVGATSFSAGDCMSTDIFDNTGASVDGSFEEVLLSDTTNTIFVSLLEEDLLGFDSANHDFEMLVPEDGHNGDTSSTPYFFYIELE